MNQTQIAYFRTQVEATLQHVKSLLVRRVKSVPELSTAEKAAQIQNGKARFRIEKFSGPKCPWDASDLFKFFEFEGEDEIVAKNAAALKEQSKLIAKAEREAQRIATSFVLEKLKDPVQALDDFIEKYAPASDEDDAELVLQQKTKKRSK